jgi:HPt (histidine-containing phosphotransfer) domain-containing protein
MSLEPTNPTNPLLDPSQLETFIMLGYEDYADLLGDVERDVPGYFNIIHSAIASGDSKACSAATHSCRGMLSYFGCVALTSLLAELENGVLPDKSRAESVHNELLTTWESTLNAILKWEKSVPDFAPDTPR